MDINTSFLCNSDQITDIEDSWPIIPIRYAFEECMSGDTHYIMHIYGIADIGGCPLCNSDLGKFQNVYHLKIFASHAAPS